MSDYAGKTDHTMTQGFEHELILEFASITAFFLLLSTNQILWLIKNYISVIVLMLLLFSIGLQRLKAMSRESNFVSYYGVQRCQITEVVFYTKVLVNDICDRVCRKWSYSLSNCMYLTIHNLTCVYGTSPTFAGHFTLLT